VRLRAKLVPLAALALHLASAPAAFAQADEEPVTGSDATDAGDLPDGDLPDQVLPDQALPDQVLPDQTLPDQELPSGADQ